MQYFTVQARSNREAIEKMKSTYGEDARILTHRAVRIGGFLGLFSSEGVEVTGYLAEDGARRRKAEVEEEKRKILDSVKKDQTLQVLLQEIQGLRETLQRQPPAAAAPVPAEPLHPSLRQLEELLAANEFSEDYISALRERARRDLSLEMLENFPLLQKAAVEWIGERIAVDPPLVFTPRGGTRVVIVVGPTGVGKTTTIAKLAAIYGLGDGRTPPRKVRIVTIDNYRIAAKQQIETYAEIMRIPVSLVESAEDLRKNLAIYQDSDLVLVDTIGRSPRDLGKLAEMKEILSACGSRATVYLALAATTKASDTEEILRQYAPFGFRSVILTKLDETMRIGNILSCLSRQGIPVSYLCDGQGVPQDLEEASVVRLLMNMEGFRIDREALEQKFAAVAAAASRSPLATAAAAAAVSAGLPGSSQAAAAGGAAAAAFAAGSPGPAGRRR
ncbi:MAG TPA: flagellar biosynthesis protein FlhF [Spirochaetia bacterium]|nr:flagellar biosynthesis protein FlhF [Spirochaetia bacterium]